MATRTLTRPSVRPEAIRAAFEFPALEAIFTRRARRFALGAELTGPLAYRSTRDPVPLAYEEEARLLGARRTQLWRRVQLPLLAPALARAGFLAFLVAWSDYLVTLIVGGGEVVTLPLVVASAASGLGNDAAVAVLSLGAVVPPVLLLAAIAGLGRRWGVVTRPTDRGRTTLQGEAV